MMVVVLSILLVIQTLQVGKLIGIMIGTVKILQNHLASIQ